LQQPAIPFSNIYNSAPQIDAPLKQRPKERHQIS
jgi:hypothetical protein